MGKPVRTYQSAIRRNTVVANNLQYSADILIINQQRTENINQLTKVVIMSWIFVFAFITILMTNRSIKTHK